MNELPRVSHPDQLQRLYSRTWRAEINGPAIMVDQKVFLLTSYAHNHTRLYITADKATPLVSQKQLDRYGGMLWKNTSTAVLDKFGTLAFGLDKNTGPIYIGDDYKIDQLEGNRYSALLRISSLEETSIEEFVRSTKPNLLLTIRSLMSTH